MCSLRWPFFPHPGAAPMPAPHWIHSAATRWACTGIALAAAACAPLSPKPAKTSEAPPVAAACPPALAALARCLAGRDSAGPTTSSPCPTSGTATWCCTPTVGQLWARLGPNARRQTWSAGPSWSRPVMHGRAAPSARAAWKCALRRKTPNACGRSLWAMWRSRAAPSCTGSRGVPAWRRGGRDVHFHNPRPAPV